MLPLTLCLMSKSHLKYMSLPLHGSIFFYTQFFSRNRQFGGWSGGAGCTAGSSGVRPGAPNFPPNRTFSFFPFRVARGEQFFIIPFFPTTSHHLGRRPASPPLHLDLFPTQIFLKTHTFEDRAIWRLSTEGFFVLRAALGDLPLGPPSPCLILGKEIMSSSGNSWFPSPS